MVVLCGQEEEERKKKEEQTLEVADHVPLRNHPSEQFLEEQVSQIMAMGFTDVQARRALRGGQTLERALESLLSP